MALSEYVLNTDIKRQFFKQYSEGSVSSFGTQFNTDFASVLGATAAVVAKPGASTVALVIVSPTQVLEVNPTDYVGYNGQVWQVVTAATLAAKYTASSD